MVPRNNSLKFQTNTAQVFLFGLRHDSNLVKQSLFVSSGRCLFPRALVQCESAVAGQVQTSSDTHNCQIRNTSSSQFLISMVELSIAHEKIVLFPNTTELPMSASMSRCAAVATSKKTFWQIVWNSGTYNSDLLHMQLT